MTEASHRIVALFLVPCLMADFFTAAFGSSPPAPVHVSRIRFQAEALQVKSVQAFHDSGAITFDTLHAEALASMHQEQTGSVASQNRAAILEAMTFKDLGEARDYLHAMGIVHLMPQWVLPTPPLPLEMGKEFLSQLGLTEQEAQDLFSVYSVPESTLEKHPELRERARVAFSSRSGQRAFLFPVRRGLFVEGHTFHLIQVRGLGIAEYARFVEQYKSDETARFSESFRRFDWPEPEYELGKYTRDAGLFRKRTARDQEMAKSGMLWKFPELRAFLARDIMLFDVQGFVDSEGQYRLLSTVQERREYKECAAVVTLHHSYLPRLEEIFDTQEDIVSPEQGLSPDSPRWAYEFAEWEGLKRQLSKVPWLHQQGDFYGASIYLPTFLATLCAGLLNHRLNSSQMSAQNLKLDEFADFHHFTTEGQFVEEFERQFIWSWNSEQTDAYLMDRQHFDSLYAKYVRRNELFWPYYIFSGDVRWGFQAVDRWRQFVVKHFPESAVSTLFPVQKVFLETFFNTLDFATRTNFFFFIADMCLYVESLEARNRYREILKGTTVLPKYLKGNTEDKKLDTLRWLFDVIAAHFDMPELAQISDGYLGKENANILRHSLRTTFDRMHTLDVAA